MKVTMKVPGMHCKHCEAAVKEALAEVKGVLSAVVDLERKTVDVEFEGVELAALKTAIEDVGFDVEE